jgi:HSP20 family protein
MFRSLLPTIWRRTDVPLRRVEISPFFTFSRELDEVLDSFVRGYDVAPVDVERTFGAFTPSVDILEDEKEVHVKAELPGLEEKDVEVNLTDGRLTIRGEKKEETEDKGKDYWHKESRYGSFTRVITLPEGIDAEKVDAHFKNGVLDITLPRLEEAKEKVKKIEIKAD